MGDWIQESHNVSIKTLYFNSNINNWNHVLTSHITYVQDDSNTFLLTVSGENNPYDYYIKNVLDSTTVISQLPNNIVYQLDTLVIKGFWNFNFQNANNNLIDISGFDFQGVDISECDFSGISLHHCNFKDATIKDTSFNNISLNNTTFEYINQGNNKWNAINGRKIFNKLININNSHYYKTYVLGSGINLQNVDFSDQNIENINFENSYLQNAILPTSNFKNARFVHFTGTPQNLLGDKYKLINHTTTKSIIGPDLDITSTNLSNQNLTNHDFTNCSLFGINLNNANLTNAIFNNTIAGNFTGNISTLPNENYKVLITTGTGLKYLVGSGMKFTQVNFDSFVFDKDISILILELLTFKQRLLLEDILI